MIGIIGALNEEMAAVIERMEDVKEERVSRHCLKDISECSRNTNRNYRRKWRD